MTTFKGPTSFPLPVVFCVLTLVARLISLLGLLGGAALFALTLNCGALTALSIGGIDSASCVEKTESRRWRSPVEPTPMRTWASRVLSWLVFSRRRAFWVAARCVGEGGRGAGFIAWATCRGIVGMLTDDTTGSASMKMREYV